MNWKNFKYFEPNDGGDPGDENGTDATKPVADPMEAVKLVAQGIKDAIEASRQAAPVAATPAPNNLAAEAAKVDEDYNALMADGKFSEAALLRDRFVAKANQAGQGDPANNPLIKTAVGLGKKAAKADYPDIMKKWGDEAERYVNSLPIEERILPDAWDKAVSHVKTNHFDDILKESTEAAVKAATADFIAPGSQPGSRGRRGATATGLDELEMLACNIAGVTPEAYSKRKKEAEDYDKIPVRERGSYEGYPVIGNEVKPGRF